VESRLVATGQSADKASRAAGKPDAIRNMRRAVKEGRAGVNTGTISALAPILRTTAAWLLEAEGPEQVSDTPESPKPPQRNSGGKPRNQPQVDELTIIPGAHLVGNRDLPVFAASEGGKGAIILSSDPVDWVARPEPLARVKDGYGVIVVGESMFPALAPGDILLVNPHLPAKAGATCVFQSEQPDGTILSCIKFLRRQTADAWHVTEWNSDGKMKHREFTLKKSEWRVCGVSVGKYDG
jgi:phage repressor protein C with HTH and peptisase S24 domain